MPGAALNGLGPGSAPRPPLRLSRAPLPSFHLPSNLTGEHPPNRPNRPALPGLSYHLHSALSALCMERRTLSHTPPDPPTNHALHRPTSVPATGAALKQSLLRHRVRAGAHGLRGHRDLKQVMPAGWPQDGASSSSQSTSCPLLSGYETSFKNQSVVATAAAAIFDQADPCTQRTAGRSRGVRAPSRFL